MLTPVRLAIAGLVLLTAVPARADFTAFLGATPTTSTRRAQGLAVGSGLLVLGFEVEYAHVAEDLDAAAPSLTTGMGNLLIQTPTGGSGWQVYGTTGVGLYRERLGLAHQETHLASNIGGGIKIRLTGPLRVRFDYRVFNLQGSPLVKNPQRFYAGLNVAF